LGQALKLQQDETRNPIELNFQTVVDLDETRNPIELNFQTVVDLVADAGLSAGGLALRHNEHGPEKR
jgi:hypothetical protein